MFYRTSSEKNCYIRFHVAKLLITHILSKKSFQKLKTNEPKTKKRLQTDSLFFKDADELLFIENLECTHPLIVFFNAHNVNAFVDKSYTHVITTNNAACFTSGKPSGNVMHADSILSF